MLFSGQRVISGILGEFDDALLWDFALRRFLSGILAMVQIPYDCGCEEAGCAVSAICGTAGNLAGDAGLEFWMKEGL